MMDIDEPRSKEQKSLTFKSRLVAKTIDAKELTSRLKALHEELHAFNQDEIVKDSLDATARELVNNKILKHSSNSVKAYAATCLADMLRLYAPEAPFSEKELKNIFEFFLSQLRQLKKLPQDHADFSLYFYLLESLSTVKSILIIGDLTNAEQLSAGFFTCFFETIRTDMPRNVQVCMTDLMVQLIDEVSSLPDETLALILEQFEKGSEAPGYIMALELCNTCFDTLQRRVCQYFSDALIAMSHSNGSEEEEEELKKAHTVIQRVHAVVPNLLLNVLPQLEEEMKVDDYKVRYMATETIGNMFAEANSTMFQRYPNIWKTWVGRRNDKSVQLRIKWIEKCKDIYHTHPDIMSELNNCFKEKVIDPDERVRAAACRIISELDYSHIVRDLDKSVLELVAERSKDKKSSVRKEAMTTLGKLYNTAYPDIADGNGRVKEKLGWIPNSLFTALYADDLSATATLESTVNQYLLPYIESDKERTERLVLIIESLGSRSKSAFRAYIHKQRSCTISVHSFIKACAPSEQMDVDYDAETSQNNKLETVIKYIAASFAESARLSSALKRFAEVQADKKTLLELLEAATNPNSEYNHIIEAKNSLNEELQEALPGSYEILDTLLTRACPVILNKTIIPHLFGMLEAPRTRRRATPNPKAAVAQDLLKEISTCFPIMYESHVYELVRCVIDGTNQTLVDHALELLAQVSKSKVTLSVYDSDILDKLSSFIHQGTLTQARHASIVLSNMDAYDICDEVIENAMKHLSVDDPLLAPKLTSLAEFSLYMPERIGVDIQTLADFVINELMTNPTETIEDQELEWVPYDELEDNSKAKLAGLQALVNYLISSIQLEADEALVERVFDLLWLLLETSCEVAISKEQSAPESSHLRLAAAQSMIKLTHMPAYERHLTVSQFEHLALTVQDTCYQVRYGYAQTVMKGIPVNQVHQRYLPVLFLSAHDPEDELLKQIKNFIQKRSLKQSDNSTTETSFVQLLHILAHHPDFTVATDDLIVFMQYFEFYLSCVATPENVSFLYHVAQKIKSSKDMVSHELSQNSYVLADLASLLIKRKCEDASWPLNVYSTRIRLQSKLYRSLPSGPVQTETLKRSYLPATFLEWLDVNYQPHRKGGEKRGSATSTASSKRNRTN